MSSIPYHIAIVMDGNGRWAKRRFMPRIAGHKQGVDSLRRCVKACVERGVGVLTVFAFSSENWNRPADEVSGLMELMALALGREVPRLQADGVRLYFVGERAGCRTRSAPVWPRPKPLRHTTNGWCSTCVLTTVAAGTLPRLLPRWPPVAKPSPRPA